MRALYSLRCPYGVDRCADNPALLRRAPARAAHMTERTVPSDLQLLERARAIVARGECRSTWSAVCRVRWDHAGSVVRPVDLNALWGRWRSVLDRPTLTRQSALEALDRAIGQARGKKVEATAGSPAAKEPPYPNDGVLEIPIAEITLGRNIREPDPAQLKELVGSIQEVGVLEPVLLARRGDKLELVAGYRRVAAARRASLTRVPARILDVTAAEVAEIQLTENLQRENLSVLEEARAFKEYVAAGHTQAELATRMGKSAPYVSNRLRLLDLPPAAAAALEDGKLSPSHAEVLLQLPKEATKGDVEGLLYHAVNLAEPVGRLAERVRWRAEAIRIRTKRKQSRAAAIEGSKFAVCPVKGCGGRGQPDVNWKGEVGPTFSDRKGHTWSRKNGELIKSRSPSGPRAAAAPPAPTLPLVDVALPSPVSAIDFWEALERSSPRLSRLGVRVGSGRVSVDLEVQSARSHPSLLPSFDFGERGEVKMRGAGEWAQGTDAARREWAKRREVLRTWLAGFARKARPSRASKGRKRK